MTRPRVGRATVGATLAVLALVVVTASPATPGTTVTNSSGSIQFLSYGPPDWRVGSGRWARIYAIDARGGGKLREVLTDVGEAHWSPDGKRLAYLRVIGGTKSVGLYVRGTSGRVRLVAQYFGLLPPAIGHTFSWSPDGTRLAYSFFGEKEIRIVGLDGSRIRIGPGESPVWSPDGRGIAFTLGDRVAPNGGALYVADARGGKTRLVRSNLGVTTTSVFALSPQAWSPDGSKIVAGSSRGLAIIDLRSGHTVLADGFKPSWSPNGRWIAASAGIRRGVWLLRPDGSGARTSGRMSVDTPMWSPDSRTLAVVDTCCSNYEADDVWAISIPSGDARRVTEGGDRYGYTSYVAEWHPTGAPTSKLPGRYVSASTRTGSLVERDVLRTLAPIAQLAADDGAVAVRYAGCRTEVWRPAQASSIGFDECGAVGMAGERLAWTNGPVGWGDGERWFASTSTHSRPRVTTLPRPWPTYRPLGPPEGDGELIVFALWGTCYSLAGDCTPNRKHPGELYRIDGERLVRVATSPLAMTVVSVDGGRILVDHENGELDLLRPNGSVIRTFRLNADVVRAVELQGRNLVVRTTSAVEVTNAENGEYLGRWPLPSADARLEDVQDEIAVFVDGGSITLLRLGDGKTSVIEAPSPRNVLAQIEPSGLFYSYRVDDPKHPGRVRYVPFDQLELGRG